jgi:hypothetical protein
MGGLIFYNVVVTMNQLFKHLKELLMLGIK